MFEAVALSIVGRPAPVGFDGGGHARGMQKQADADADATTARARNRLIR
jgi:hypothetical protein